MTSADAAPLRALAPRRIERAPLLARLAASMPARCVLLHGPAGCGKSSVLQGWRPMLVQAQIDVAWLASGEAAPALPLHGRVRQAIAVCLPGLVDEAERVAGHGAPSLVGEHVMKALLAGLADHGDRLALVIDLGRTQPDAESVQMLQFILDEAPANLLVVIAARRRPPLALSRLRANGELVELGFDDLCFSTEEGLRFLQAAAPGLAPVPARALLAVTEGWPMVLSLIAGHLRARGMVTVPAISAIPELQDYIAAEVLAQLSPAEREALAAASAPARVCPALMVALWGGTLALQTAMALMERLEAAELLRPVTGDTAEWRQVQPVVRAVLQHQLEHRALGEQQRLHQAAWNWFERNGNPVGAVHHAMAAGHPNGAIQLAEHWLPMLFQQGRIWDLVRIFRELPHALQAKPSLRHWWAWHQLLGLDFDGCRASLRALADDVQAPRDAYRVTLLRALLAMFSDNAHAAIALLPLLQTPPPDADPFSLAGRRNVLTWTCLRVGDHALARRTQLEEPTLVDGRALMGTPFGTLAGSCLLGLSHAVEGRMLLAERIYREVLYQAELRGTDGLDQVYLAAALLGEVLYELNDVDGAARLLEARRDVLVRVSMPDTVLRVMLTLARTRSLAGRDDDALAVLQQLGTYAEQRGLPRLLAYSWLEQLSLHLGRGQQAAALVCQDWLRQLEPARRQALDVSNIDLALAAGHGRVLMARQDGRLRDALQACDGLIALCDAQGRQRRAAVLQVQAAVIERADGHGSRAMERLRMAVRSGRALGLVRSLLDADPAAADLLQEGIDSGAFDAVDAIDARRLCAAARAIRVPAPASLARPAQEPARGAAGLLNARERDVCRLLAQTLSNKAIAKALGLSPETVKWHLKNIYLKLGVNSRAEVVTRL